MVMAASRRDGITTCVKRGGNPCVWFLCQPSVLSSQVVGDRVAIDMGKLTFQQSSLAPVGDRLFQPGLDSITMDQIGQIARQVLRLHED